MTGGEKGINEGNRSLRLARGRLEQELFLKAVSGIGTVAGVCCATACALTSVTTRELR